MGSDAFQQGGWETDETVAEAAARESLEEAGVRGELQARGPGAAPGSRAPWSAIGLFGSFREGRRARLAGRPLLLLSR